MLRYDSLSTMILSLITWQLTTNTEGFPRSIHLRSSVLPKFIWFHQGAIESDYTPVWFDFVSHRRLDSQHSPHSFVYSRLQYSEIWFKQNLSASIRQWASVQPVPTTRTTMTARKPQSAMAMVIVLRYLSLRMNRKSVFSLPGEPDDEDKRASPSSCGSERCTGLFRSCLNMANVGFMLE